MPDARRFGSDIAIVGDTAVIAGLQHAFIFTRDAAGVWSEHAQLSELSGQFIGPVDFDGARILVATGAFDEGNHEAHLFTNDGGGWTIAASMLTPPVLLGAIRDIQLDGDRVALGKPDAAGPDRAYVYHDAASSSWMQEAMLDPNNLENDSFGMEVALAADLLLVGANHAGAHGITYLYQRDDSGTWSLLRELMPSDTFAHNFGDEIDFQDGVPVIGSWAHHENGLYSGAVYVFDPIAAPIFADLNGDSVVDEDDRAVLCGAIGSLQGQPSYVPVADLNEDGAIDHFDQQIFNDILPPCAGDVVSSATFAPPADGVTDGADLAFLLGAWGAQPSCADMVSSATFQPPPDGKVDGADLAYMLGAWGACD